MEENVSGCFFLNTVYIHSAKLRYNWKPFYAAAAGV